MVQGIQQTGFLGSTSIPVMIFNQHLVYTIQLTYGLQYSTNIAYRILLTYGLQNSTNIVYRILLTYSLEYSTNIWFTEFY